MACSRPMLFVDTGARTETGKRALKFLCSSDLGTVPDSVRKNPNVVQVPCGKCTGCRLAYSRQWADRCLLESLYHEYNWFLTLTYDDVHVPVSAVKCEDDFLYHLTLNKRDLQLFFKRLRKVLGDVKIRYYACGEYGDTTFRPHYHVLLYGCNFEDLKPYRYSRGNWLFTSQFLDDVWKNGECKIAYLSWETCAYTARYVMKKAKGFTSSEYEFLGIEPEFVVMSRKPGIGYQYFQDHKDSLFDYLSFSVLTEKGGRKLRPPKYYEKLYEDEFPGSLDDFRAKRKISAELRQELKLKQTNLSWQEYLLVEERMINDRATKLIRSDM